MNYDYNQLFAKEYSGYSRIRHGAEAVSYTHLTLPTTPYV